MAISRMQQPRQLRGNGGILTLEDAKKMAPPGESLAYINKDEAKLLKSIGGAGEDVNGTGIKSYFFKKIFKKAKRAVKKVAKSPIGKAALLAGGAYLAGGFMPGGGGFTGGLSNFSNFGRGVGSLFNKGFTRGKGLFDKGNLLAGLVRNPETGEFSLGRTALTGLGAAGILAPFLMKGGDEEEVEPETPFTQTPDSIASIVNMARQQDPSLRFLPKPKFVDNFYAADGGIARIPMQEGGMMDMGGLEKDYREGGFVPIGEEERADDVPARLSKNEFVFTADAVRAAGGGDIDKGAEVMQNMMDNLEAGGMISEESQGMNPAQSMFDQAQMLEGRLA
jgi:hypothetical protein